MQKWEYEALFIRAGITTEESRQYIQSKWPGSNMQKHDIRSLGYVFDHYGEQGWELVHIEPVAEVGLNEDISFRRTTATWGKDYFCVFKRPIAIDA